MPEKNEYVYILTEKNVDGCGGDASETVVFDHRLDDGQVEVLKTCLADAKAMAASEDMDTGDIVNAALTAMTGKTGIRGEIRNVPYEAEIGF